MDEEDDYCQAQAMHGGATAATSGEGEGVGATAGAEAAGDKGGGSGKLQLSLADGRVVSLRPPGSTPPLVGQSGKREQIFIRKINGEE